MKPLAQHILMLAGAFLLATTPLAAQTPPRTIAVTPGHVVLPEISAEALRQADERRVLDGEVPHYAVALPVEISPWNEDRWRLVGGKASWRLRLTSPGASSLNLAFGRFSLPQGGRLTIRSADGSQALRSFTELDNDAHGQLWTPPLLSDDLVLDLSVPLDVMHQVDLELSLVHHGYAGFGAPSPKAGQCHVDVACPEADSWNEVARSVALISIEGVRFCSGFLVNNTALDGRPLFVTAEHCGINADNAASLVVLWKHQRQTCDPRSGEPASWTFQTGSIWRASHVGSDMALVELDDMPPTEAAVFYAGWDRSLDVPRETATVHHPNTAAKRISFDHDPAVVSSHLSRSSSGRGQHLRVDAWDVGSTEGGSSGAPLFNGDKRVVGQLHGGYAACGKPQPDWFGRFSASWRGRGRLGTRLSDWLDPIGAEPLVLNGLDGSVVTP